MSSSMALIVVLAAVLAGAMAALWAMGSGESNAPEQPVARTPQPIPDSAPYSVVIHKPDPPRVTTAVLDDDGNPVTVSCGSCHATRPANHDNRTAADLDEFHANLHFSHGSLTCLACHNASNYDTLRLADGASVDFPEVMTMCAQCHSAQMRDYEHGAHGGMNGYWDLQRGPRTKLNCVDCHPPHAPQFPKMRPTFKPKDRFLLPPGEAH